MNDPTPAPDFDIELLIELCVMEVVSGVDLDGYHQRLGQLVPTVFPRRAGDAAQALIDWRVANGVARAIWKHCPHPAHRYAPAPLPVPERNAPCHCGSLRKYKHCCQPAEALGSLERFNFLIPVLTFLPKKRWPELADSRVAVDAVVDVALTWEKEGRHADVVALLEPWFKHDRHWSARHEPLMDLLLDAYTVLHHPRKKSALLDRALAHGDAAMRTGALQRRATMAADEGDYATAWAVFKQAQRAEPESPHLAHLEVILLMSERREPEARERAGFWLARLARRNDPELVPQLDFLRQIAEQGANALVDMASSRDPTLATYLQRWREAPPLACLYALEPADGFAGPLTPTPKLERALSRWRECFGPIDYSPLRQNAGDWWDDAERWLGLLDRHPELWNAFEVLDGLVHALDELPMPGVAERLRRPLLERGEALLRHVLRANDADGLPLEWGWLQNRPALNLLGALIATDLGTEPVPENVARMQWCVLTLNPNDNQGFRQELMRAYLALDRFDEALALSARYPDDFAAMRYNQALALFATGRGGEAALALREAIDESPRLLKTLLADKPKPAKPDGWGIQMGGPEEAWLYRQAHHALWQRFGALDWARQVARTKRR